MNTLHRQRGATLIVGMIMLVLLTLLGLSAFNTSISYFRVIGNMKYQTEASTCTQSALNQVLSHGAYFNDPTTAPLSYSCDINGDNSTDYTVALTRPCVLKSVPILLSELSVSVADDVKCMGSGVKANTGVMGQNTGAAPSECARVTWRVSASVSDPLTKASTQITEGASVRMDLSLANIYAANAAFRCAP